MTMTTKAIALVAAILLLAGCSSAPSAEDRSERASEAMEAIQATDSELIADYMAEQGIYDDIADDLVDICDSGTSTPHAYIAGFDDAAMEPVIMAGWEVACP